MSRLNTAASAAYSRVTNANRPSGVTATSIAPPGGPFGCRGAASTPSTAPAVPASARATLSTTAPLPSATSRYRPSGVTTAPAGAPAAEDGSGTYLTTVTAGADPTPLETPSRSTSTDAATAPDPPNVVAKAHRPSGVAATPNGERPAATDVVPAGPSARPGAVAAEQPGDASARPVGAGTAPAVVWGEVGVPDAAAWPVLAARAAGELADVHPAPAPSAIAASRQAPARCRCAKPRPMR